MFDSPTNLHCSQTSSCYLTARFRLIPLRICTALKRSQYAEHQRFVWFPYEFALLSNLYLVQNIYAGVWFPYEFALLSNRRIAYLLTGKFDSPTNLHCSQTWEAVKIFAKMFDSPTNLHCSQTGDYNLGNLIMFDSPTNLHCSQTYAPLIAFDICLIPLRICTALKLKTGQTIYFRGLIPLRICTALKQTIHLQTVQLVWFPYEFALLSNLKCLK